MANNPNTNKYIGLPQRKSIRLKGYDYTQAGLYFITICTQNRAWLFGEIMNGKMILNDAGNMIKKWYYELENKFPDIRCHEMIIMPNHFHCIIENVGTVGANLRVRPNISGEKPLSGEHVGSPQQRENVSGENRENILGEKTINVSGENRENILGEKPINVLGEHVGSPQQHENILGEKPINVLGEHVGSPLHRVIQWFKTMTTNEYIRGVKSLHWTPFDGKLWQRNYWEHIIRNEQSFQKISEYIINNPQNWNNDQLKK